MELVVGVLVIAAALAINLLSGWLGGSLRRQIRTRRARSVFGVIVLALAIAASTLTAALDARRSELGGRPDAIDESDLMWDAQGLRPGIVYRDSLTPWADQPLFNAIINREPGDERQFVRAVVVGRDAEWKTRLTVRAGDELRVKVLVSNEAEPLLNDAPDRRGVAVGTRVAVGFADAASTAPLLFAVVSADNAAPAWVAASLELRSDSPVRLRYRPGSAVLAAGGREMGVPDLAFVARADDASAVSRAGALVGGSGPDGRLQAGWDQAVEVLVTFEVAEA